MKIIDLSKTDEPKKDHPKKQNSLKRPSRRRLKRLIKFETKPSFQGLLIGSFITFTLITFLSILFIFLLFNWLNRYENIDLSTAKLQDFTTTIVKSDDVVIYAIIGNIGRFVISGNFPHSVG